MRRLSLLLAILSGCMFHHHTGDGAVLGRVVVYRNGVAFYERRAHVTDGKVTVHVPRDRVDDFLKSLTVVDPQTRKPLDVSIPRRENEDGSYLTMTLEAPDRNNTDVLLTYVTESPAWKPSYRVVLGNQGKVMLEGWAIVDNVSGEDWKGVLVGVGASSALSFRYDLWSVRRIDRDLLQGEDRFAVAPPTGVSPYIEASSEELVSLGAEEVRGNTKAEASPVDRVEVDARSGALSGTISDGRTGEKLAGVTVVATSPSSPQTQTAITDDKGAYTINQLPPGTYLVSFYYGDQTIERRDVRVSANKTTPVYQKLNTSRVAGETIEIEGKAPTIDATSTMQGVTLNKNYIQSMPGRTYDSALGVAAGSSSDAAPPKVNPVKQGDAKLKGIVDKVVKSKKDVVIEAHGANANEVAARAEAVKHKLVDDGVAAARIHIVPKVGAGEATSLRVLSVAPQGEAGATSAPPTAATHAAMPDTPVGESHFLSQRPMTVRAGTSAMVAMVHGETTGGIVYLYDPVSERGDERFAFKAVRLDNPKDDTLEPGPVTVYGDGRFIGEGITEPVPPRASVVVPFALDRQVLVSRSAEQDSNRIAKLITVQRGIVNAEVQHRRVSKFTVTSRLGEPTKVYLRHRLESGWALLEAPSKVVRVGDSQLFEIDLGPGETKYVTIAEATPVMRTMQLGSDEALDMMKLYVDEPDASPALKKQIGALLATHREAADLIDKIETLKDQLAEFRSRAGELNAQLVSLKLVRTGGELMSSLRNRLAETSERTQKATLAIVDAREKLMLAKLKFGNQLADLRLTDVTATK